MVEIILKLLDPKTSEFTATFVGRLVSILISKLGPQLGDSLDLILRAVLSKMQQAETLSVIQVGLQLQNADPKFWSHIFTFHFIFRAVNSKPGYVIPRTLASVGWMMSW